MLDKLIVIGIALGYFAYVSMQAKHALHMFQQNKYELNRYLYWIKIQIVQDKKAMYSVVIKEFLMLVLVIFSLAFRLKPMILSSLYIIVFFTIFGLNVIQERQEKYIKPLHLTSRVIRQIVVMILLNMVYVYVLFSLFPTRYWGLFFLFANILQWAFVLLMQAITQPVELVIKQYYLNDAKRILRGLSKVKKIGITGSFGKTSSKHILQEILSEQYYSLMTPASYNTPMGITITIREQLKPIHEVFICEMGADKVGEIDYLTKFVRPSYGVLTSIGPQHLQTFGSLENIIHEKFRIIENLPSDGVGFLNYDNNYIREYPIQNTCKIITYAIDEPADFRAINIEYSPNGSTFDVILPNQEIVSFRTRLLGKHNITNILAAIAVGNYLEISISQLQAAVSRVNYIEHRLQLKQDNGITWIDNAFNSNPVGASMSLEVMKMMPGTRYIITPGLIDLGDKQEEYNEVFGTQMLGCVDEVYLVGINQTKSIVRGLEKSGFNAQSVHVFATIHEAFHQVRTRAYAGDTILLENDLPDAFNK